MGKDDVLWNYTVHLIQLGRDTNVRSAGRGLQERYNGKDRCMLQVVVYEVVQ